MLETLPSVRYLRVFEAVARLESVTRASAEVGLTQPAVTQAIAKLELEIGEQLFDRRTTGTYLTDFGRAYFTRTRRFFQNLERTLLDIGLPQESLSIASKIGRVTRSQIRCHIAIAQCLSFTHASAKIGISQASLHRAARDLERNVGVPLYRHTASGVVTTEAGHILATGLLASISEIESASDEAKAARGEGVSRICIGTPMLDPAPFLATVLGEFTRRYPDTSVQVVNGTFEEMRQRLRSGSLDFMLGVLKVQTPDLHDEALFKDPYVVAARSGHPLTLLPALTAGDLLNYDWIVSKPSAPRRLAFDDLFAPTGGSPKSSIESHSLATIRATLVESDRLAILTKSELAPDERMGVLTALPIGPLAEPTIGVTTRSDWLPTERQQVFLDLLRAQGLHYGEAVAPAGSGRVRAAALPR